ncbi:aromatic ring-hydroxylating dioxygenase subunit alpha [Ramlibacter sp. USB13]|uniref:Aromatic ring-hydroxylating dioxygenase subunit alpha n=1 Tax=Ramlibacter cellulosilyticus TaxID=2764187 RepID=A0A923MRJ8_9BURK|nr:aromatic ring-hydroxylating dioxygenase subunit alpha [Ramlibacter cellulosilyticus]MBC5784175.1 aromatic ring-hydroxylating dioxygenase subunit alpha [Ramlibacter cellulosilyticus]
MSDLSLQLQQAASQLPVSSYFDPALFAREQELIFQHGPRYLGHALAIPESGDYHALPQEGEGRALLRSRNGIELISNVCRHRQAVMLRGRGSVNEKPSSGGNIVCPLHRWTYSAGHGGKAGTLLGAPHFATDPCLNLNNYPVQEWNGLVFEGGAGFDVNRALAKLGPKADLDFSGYVYDRTELHEVDYNWKTFIEVYLEDYHVGPFHPGLGNFVTCEDLRWEFGPHYSVQTVGVAGKLGKPGSDVYRQWHEQVLRYQDGRMPKHGAVWLTLYPNVMVEWYPNVLVVSTLFPRGPRKTLNMVEFFYPEEIQAFEREFVEAQQAAYMETCVEDDEIALRMDAGRKALMDRGDNEVGPYQSPMEDGMQHFHEWYRDAMGPQTALR